jgi:type II secretory pathway component GspD/PulD (secretin)
MRFARDRSEWFKQKIHFLPAIALLEILFTLVALSPCVAEVWVYPMQYRPASEALPSIQTMLSREGRAVADPRTNSLLIDDDERSIERIKQFLASFDQLGKQARIRVKFIEGGTSESSRVEADARASGSGWAVTTDPRKKTDGVDVRLQDRSRSRQGSSEFFLNAVSGSPAYIMVGKDILYNQRWIDLSRRYARVVETVAVQRVETGFEVLPVILKDHVDVEITPRISHETPSKAGRNVIRFSELSTHVYAPLNQWVSIGGAEQSSNEVMREILGRGSSSQASNLSVLLMVEAQ